MLQNSKQNQTTQKLHIAVLRGGLSEEREVSLKSGEYVLENLDKSKYKVTDVVVNSLDDVLSLAKLTPKVDIAFLALHGKFAEDGKVQALLELMRIKYTGASIEASVIGFDKFLFKQILHSTNASSPKGQKLKTPNDIVVDYQANVLWHNFRKVLDRVCLRQTVRLVKEHLKFPVFVKPNTSGSSYGISKANNEQELRQAVKKAKEFGNKVIIEKAITGLELSIGFVGKHILPPVLIRPKKGKFFDYQSKYETAGAEEICPAPIENKVINKLKKYTKQIITILGDVKYGRIDAIYDPNEQEIYVLEINTLPGMTKTSLLPQEARAYGWSNSQLLDEIIELSK